MAHESDEMAEMYNRLAARIENASADSLRSSVLEIIVKQIPGYPSTTTMDKWLRDNTERMEKLEKALQQIDEITTGKTYLIKEIVRKAVKPDFYLCAACGKITSSDNVCIG